MSKVDNDHSEDDFDWEEVQVPDHNHEQQQQHLEITIQAAGSSPSKKETAKHKGIPHAERVARINCHKLHTVALLANASVRNRWINDPLLLARLLSLTPLSLQNAFGLIHKSRIPDQNQRGRMFEAAITNLVDWWSSTFFEVAFQGHIRNRTYDSVQTKLDALNLTASPDAVLDLEDVQDMLGEDPEVIRSPNSLMKHALMRSGSRDTSAQLFTALCRGLSIPARLVVSLQSVPWQTHVGKPRPTYDRKDKGKGRVPESPDADEDMDEVDIPDSPSTFTTGVKGKGKVRAFTGEGQRLDGLPVPPKSDKAKGKEKAKPPIRLRKTKSKGHVLGSAPGPSSSTSSSRLGSPSTVDPTTTPPIFWTEVFSRPDARWLPVDPIRSIVNKRKVFDPTPVSIPPAAVQPSSSLFPFPAGRRSTPNPTAGGGKSASHENRMLYVLAFEEDGYARDVTRRYAREFSARIAKVQGGSGGTGGGGKARVVWWERVVGAVSRPYRLHRDDVEDEELDTAQLMEGMPTTITGFKDHPLYALTRHLKQSEVIHPPPPDTPELGKFRGEPVYPRSAVVSLKTAENWMRSEGRTVSQGSQPLKMVKVRAGTVNKMRELEVLREAGAAAAAEGGEGGGEGGRGGGEAMQGLYARSQTEVYRPDPVVDGKVPKNNFGNIDLYVPSMLPQGAVHIPFKRVAKLARKLDIDFAEAVTGFEFKKRRAFPILEGVVVAQENETVLLEAYWEAEKEAARKAEAKRTERVIKHWTRLIHGLRIRQRLQAQYSTKAVDGVGAEKEEGGDCEDKHKGDAILGMSAVNASGSGAVGGGGFLTAADDVVQPYHLPRYKFQSAVDGPVPGPAGSVEEVEEVEVVMEVEVESPGGVSGYAHHTMDVDSEQEEAEMEAVLNPAPEISGLGMAPKTMRELAEDAEEERRRRGERERDAVGDVEVVEIGGVLGDVVNGNGGVPVNGKVGVKAEVKGGVRIRRTNGKGRGRGGSVPAAPRSKAENKGSRSVKATGRGRKRRRDNEDEDEEAEEEEEEEDGDNVDGEGEEGSNEDDDEASSLPPKKKLRSAPPPRPSTAAAAPSTSTPTAGGRILRPRRSKTAAQLQEEQEQETAYRHAISQ